MISGCPALIEWGWDEPDQTFLRTHVTLIETKSFDGVVLHLTVPGEPQPRWTKLIGPALAIRGEEVDGPSDHGCRHAAGRHQDRQGGAG